MCWKDSKNVRYRKCEPRLIDCFTQTVICNIFFSFQSRFCSQQWTPIRRLINVKKKSYIFVYLFSLHKDLESYFHNISETLEANQVFITQLMWTRVRKHLCQLSITLSKQLQKKPFVSLPSSDNSYTSFS